MDAIIPAAGLASRMRGIPKFLLPCDKDYTTLIELHINALLIHCETIWIPTRPDLVLLVDSLGISKERVIVLPLQTANMTQTVSRVVEISKAESFHLVMPDTFFFGDQPYAALDKTPNLVDMACWRIRPEQKGKLGQVKLTGNLVIDMKDKDPTCDYEYSWGSLTFNRRLLEYSKSSDPHIGYGVFSALSSGENIHAKLIDGYYYDCGTPSEYLSMLQAVIN